MKDETLFCRITATQKQLLERLAAERGESVSVIAREAIREYLARAVSPSPPPIASSKIVAAVSPQISIEQARDLATSYADPLKALSAQPDQAFPSTADPVETPAKPRASLRRRRLRR